LGEIEDVRLVWALGRIGGEEVSSLLLRLLRASRPSIRSHALRGLMRAHEWSALKASYVPAQTEHWPHLPMGLGGDRQAVTILQRQLESGRASRETIMALGLLGDPTTTRSLVSALQSDQHVDATSMALRWITGASLYEEVFVPEPVDESELFEAEKVAWRERGEPPRRADGRPFGVDVRQLSRDPVVWSAWIDANGHEFDPDTRYRLGRPYCAEAVLLSVGDAGAPLEWRQAALDELLVRFGCNLGCEADDRVARQLKAQGSAAAWLRTREKSLEPTRGRFVLGMG
jgi:hypothetical protein